MTTLKWHLHGWMNLPVKIYFRANKPILDNKVYWVLLGRISNGSICQTKLRFLVYITSMRAELLLIVWKACCSIFHRPIKTCLKIKCQSKSTTNSTPTPHLATISIVTEIRASKLETNQPLILNDHWFVPRSNFKLWYFYVNGRNGRQRNLWNDGKLIVNQYIKTLL